MVSMPVAADYKIGGYALDIATIDKIYKEARESGAKFSLAQLVDEAKKIVPDIDPNQDTFSPGVLETAAKRFVPSCLPQQYSDAHSPAVGRAVVFAYLALREDFESHSLPDLPDDNLSRIIVDSRGAMKTNQEIIVSAFVERSDYLRNTNKIYFGTVQFGQPDRFYGPFPVDKLGIPIEPAPEICQTILDEAEVLGTIPSQKIINYLKADRTCLSYDLFAFDLTEAVDIEAYTLLAERQSERLTKAQQVSLAGLSRMAKFGSQIADVNELLRSKKKNIDNVPEVVLLDSVFDHGILLPPGLTLFRGIACDKLVGLSGKILTDSAYLSTTLEPGVAKQFADNNTDNGRRKILMVIEIGTGTRGVITGNKGETEILLPRNTKLEVLGKKRQKGYEIWWLRTQNTSAK